MKILKVLGWLTVGAVTMFAGYWLITRKADDVLEELENE